MLPSTTEVVHPYMVSSPGCWAGFGELQATEMARFGYPPAHGLVVDAYAASHGGDGTERRDRQSVFIHPMAICAALEQDVSAASRTVLLRRVTAGHPDWPALTCPPGHPRLDFTHLVGNQAYDAYADRAHEWARAVWEFWEPVHGQVRAALQRARNK